MIIYTNASRSWIGEDVLVTEYVLLTFVNLEDILVRVTVSVLVELMGLGERGIRHDSAGIMAFITDRLHAGPVDLRDFLALATDYVLVELVDFGKVCSWHGLCALGVCGPR